MMTGDRRHEVSPEIIFAIQTAVKQAFEDNAYRCLIGLSAEDKENMVELSVLLKEYPPVKLRESFHLVQALTRARNMTGNIVFSIIIAGLSVWGLSKLFSGINWK